MLVIQETLSNYLQRYFGFDKFKGNQEEIINSLLNGSDTFVIMPTGGGKSLCYQLPAMILPGTAIIISPLIALMKNQVDSIRGYSEDDDVAHFLNSSLSKTQAKYVKECIKAGKTKLLYVAPETLTKDENIEFFKQVDLSFIAVDEAHCISEWGHDFRPEYRRIRTMIDALDQSIPVIALTATATPKVQSDIVKNLNMKDEKTFISSFNRENLYYEVRPKVSKKQTIKEIVQVIKKIPGQSGIIYVQSRKSTEELAEVLNVNGIKASPYHAGLDSKLRSSVQDDFIMEEIDVICATIAFGMGIDKPDVRFVIHYNMPKSIENYYQETGRAGRDGLGAKCIAFYSYKDILALEKFLRDKPVAEREMGAQLLEEVVAYAETTSCRRRFLLHYFGEDFDEKDCGEMCDNGRYPKERIEAKDQIQLALKAVDELKENYGIKVIVDFLRGTRGKEIKEFSFDSYPGFGLGKEHSQVYWHSILRNALLSKLLYKDIEKYGLLKLTDKGREFIQHPASFEISINNNYQEVEEASSSSNGKSGALDKNLLDMLKDLRRKISREKSVPPYVIFQDPSLDDMATQYPISVDDMTKITGVSMGKARRYAKPFIELIKEYVEEYEIERPTEIVVKQVANKSKLKVSIIQGIDRKMPLEDLASSINLSMDQLIEDMEMIVNSGTKLNIDYYLDETIDDGSQEDIFDYFMDSDTAELDVAFEGLREDDITLDEIKLMRIKFLSDMAN
jgi:ATP-dependent DNA helicase RecQ